ncbi:hypothetical protein [Sedimentibacter sp.]|uniref:hypothetical protein n=1 Tax=Sedimentibacter sp. TaxID=1960295 RepID=UPI000EBAEB6A|nr:hypothetical protein [Sedimentibacter sp.]HCX62918.1 hypothetical protein [Clostridiales bacterium]
MNFIIIASIIAVFFINFYFIDEIFKIVELPAENTVDICQTKSFNNMRTALICGDIDICHELSELLEQHNVSSIISNDKVQLCHPYPYDYLIVVHSSDLDNLTICSIGMKIFGINNVISICNQQYNKRIYEENNIPYLFRNNLTASDIVYKLLNICNNRS